MNKFVKYGVSLVALTIGVTAAIAQDQRPRERGQEAQMERQGSGERERGMQRRERGGEERAQRSDEERSRDSGERRERMGQDSDENRKSGDRADGRKERGDKERASRSEDRRDRDRADRGEDGRRDRDKADRGEDGRRDRDKADRRGDDRREGQRAERGERKGGKRAKVEVNITPEKKTIIRERVVTRAPKRYKRADIDFNLSIGTSIPRSYVFYDLPSVFLEIVPGYQGYDYIVVGDVLLIIDPDTREIVDIIDV